MIRSEIKDRNGKEIRAGDTLRFVNKREWYRSSHMFDTDEQIDALPFHEVEIELPKDFRWLLSPEVQEHWEIVKRGTKKKGK